MALKKILEQSQKELEEYGDICYWDWSMSGNNLELFMERQIKMAWERGNKFGLFCGITGTVLAFIIIGLIIKILY